MAFLLKRTGQGLVQICNSPTKWESGPYDYRLLLSQDLIAAIFRNDFYLVRF